MMEWIVSSSVLILVIILLRYLLQGKISLRLQYTLWALVLVRLLVPVSFGSTALSIMNPAQQVPVVQDMETLREIGGIEHTQSGNVEGYYATDYMSDFPTTIAENKSDAEFSRMKTVLDVRELLIPVWKLGIAVMLVALFISNARFRQELNRRRTRLEKPDYPLPVYVTDAVETPCLFGLFSPTVYITPEVQANPITLYHALEHELTHFRHGDHFWSVLRCMCLALHWYNPLVWAAVILSRRDAELACDEGTIRRIGESERIAYGNTLIDLTCTKRKPSVLLCTATTMTGSKKSIKERVTLIAKKPKMLWITVVAVILAAAVAVGCTFTGAKKATSDASGEVADAVPLTAEDLAYFNDEFFNGDEFNIHNQFLSSLYDIPQDIDLFELFYCGTGMVEDITDEERQAVGAIDENGEEVCPTDKLPISIMDTVLIENMGLTLDQTNQIGLEYFDYRQEYDAYYHTHGDTNYYFLATFTSGARQGDLLSLVYEDGGKVVTLRETKDGGYQFVSNRYDAAPAISETSVPKEKSVLSVKLSELSRHMPAAVETEAFIRQDWGEMVDSFWYQGAGAEPDRSILVGNWPGEGIFACYVVYDDTAGEDVYHRFAQLCTTDSAQIVLEHPDWVSIAPFTDLFGYDGFVITSDGLSRYYFFGKDGKLNLLYSTYGKLDRLFTAGGDCTYAFDDAGHAHDPAMLVQKGGELYRADLSELLTRLTPELFDPWLDVSASSGLATLRYSDTSLEQMPLCIRRVCCDGKAIQFYYGDGKTYTGHLVDGIDVPEEVLTAAQTRAQAAYQRILDNKEGFSDLASWNPDDWRIASLGLARTVSVHGLTVEIYTQSILVHTATPEKVIMAGGTYITEDGWVAQDGLSGEYFILPFVIENGQRILLTGELANDYGVDSPAFDSDLRKLMLDNGLIAITDLTGQELLHDFDMNYAHFLTCLGNLEDSQLDIICGKLVSYAAEDQEYWNHALTTSSYAAGSMDERQKLAYQRILSYVNGDLTTEIETASPTLTASNLPFTDQPISLYSPLNGMFERTYEAQLRMITNPDQTNPPFLLDQQFDFDVCTVLLGESLDLETVQGYGTAYILFKSGTLGVLPLPYNDIGVTVTPAAVLQNTSDTLDYAVMLGNSTYTYTVNLTQKTVSMTRDALAPETPGVVAWREAKAEAQFTARSLKSNAASRTYDELLSWLTADENDGTASLWPVQYWEQDGYIAYLAQWVGTPHTEQYVFYVYCPDGTECQLELPANSAMGIATPDSVHFEDGKLSYKIVFTDDLYLDSYLHFAGTYTYTMNLAAKTLSLSIT